MLTVIKNNNNNQRASRHDISRNPHTVNHKQNSTPKPQKIGARIVSFQTNKLQGTEEIQHARIGGVVLSKSPEERIYDPADYPIMVSNGSGSKTQHAETTDTADETLSSVGEMSKHAKKHLRVPEQGRGNNDKLSVVSKQQKTGNINSVADGKAHNRPQVVSTVRGEAHGENQDPISPPDVAVVEHQGSEREVGSAQHSSGFTNEGEKVHFPKISTLASIEDLETLTLQTIPSRGSSVSYSIEHEEDLHGEGSSSHNTQVSCLISGLASIPLEATNDLPLF